MLDITPAIISDFRAYYPEFSDVTKYSDVLVKRCLEDADAETGGRWGKYDAERRLKQRGMFAFAAHEIVMRTTATTVSSAGGVANVVAPVASKSVNDESTSYAVVSPNYNTYIANGSLGNTYYGQEFLRLRARVVGPVWVI